MPHVIAEPCIANKKCACMAVCPVDSIHPTQEEAAFEYEEMLYIDPESCIDCGLCVDECSKNAVFPDDELPDKWKSYQQRNAEYFKRLFGG